MDVEGGIVIRTTTLFGVILSCMGSAGVAQERADSLARDTIARRIDSVVVTSPRVSATSGAASAIVVQPQQLRLSAAPRLDEALRETPFVLVRQNSRGEMEVSVRGSGSRQMAVLLDGVPLTLGWDHRSDPSLIPLTGVTSLVFVRGLSSLLLGPNVLGGLLDISLGRALRNEAPAWWGSASVDHGGAYSFSLGGALPVASSEHGGLTVRGGGSYRHRRGFLVTHGAGDPTAIDGIRTNSDLRHIDGHASLRWEGLAGRYLGLTATGYDAERGVPPELHVQSPRRWRYPNQARVVTALSAGTGLLTTPLGTGALELTAGYNQGGVTIESFEDRYYTRPGARELGDERTWTGRLLATHSLAAGQLRVAAHAAEVRYRETLDTVSASYQQRMWSAGGELHWPVLRRLGLSLGAVYDASTTPQSGGRQPVGRKDGWGWRGGLTVFANEALRLHGSVSRRARFPALRELYSGALNRFQPNPHLKPERLTATEVGATFGGSAGRAKRLTVQTVAFHHTLRDGVAQAPVPETLLLVRVNRDRIRSTGAELMAVWNSSAVPARNVSLSADLTMQHIRVHDDSAEGQRRPEHQPETRASLEIGAPLPHGVRAHVGGRYTGGQHCVLPSGAQLALERQTEAHASVERTWKLRSSGGFPDALRAVLTVSNAMNATLYDQCGLPQPARTLRLVIHVR